MNGDAETRGDPPEPPPTSVARPVPLTQAIAALVVRDCGLSPRGVPIYQDVVFVIQPGSEGMGAGDWLLSHAIRYMVTFGVYLCDDDHRISGAGKSFHLYVPHEKGACYLESTHPGDIDQ